MPRQGFGGRPLRRGPSREAIEDIRKRKVALSQRQRYQARGRKGKGRGAAEPEEPTTDYSYLAPTIPEGESWWEKLMATTGPGITEEGETAWWKGLYQDWAYPQYQEAPYSGEGSGWSGMPRPPRVEPWLGMPEEPSRWGVVSPRQSLEEWQREQNAQKRRDIAAMSGERYYDWDEWGYAQPPPTGGRRFAFGEAGYRYGADPQKMRERYWPHAPEWWDEWLLLHPGGAQAPPPEPQAQYPPSTWRPGGGGGGGGKQDPYRPTRPQEFYTGGGGGYGQYPQQYTPPRWMMDMVSWSMR